MMTLKDMLVSYSIEIVNSTQGHGKKEIQASKRFLRDVEREGTKDFPYVFDNEKALNFLRWMKLFKHTKGELAGKNIDPAPIQMFVFGNIYGWVHKDTGYRRFRRAYWQVARKNSKTQSLATVGSYEISAFGEAFSEVYIGATKSDQAKIMFDEMTYQIKASEISDKFKFAHGRITHIKSKGFITTLSKDSGKTGDGFNPQLGLIDEYHAHPNSSIYNVIETGQMSRVQPMMMVITTAGHNLNYPCYSEDYNYCARILDENDDVTNDEYFVMINELDEGDDVKDETNWPKANPIVCSHDAGLRGLRSSLKVALDVPEKMTEYLTKNMNMWVDAPKSGYMKMEKWDNMVIDDDFDEFAKGAKVYLGVDLSLTTDLTSIGLVAEKNGEYRVKQLSFLPEDKFKERMARDKVRFDIYVDNGWLVLTDGSVVDYDIVKYYILKFCEEYNVQEVCYDRWNAPSLVSQLEQEGLTMVIVEQSIRELTTPTKAFREAVFTGKLKHYDDKLLRWAMRNAITVSDPSENMKIDKKRSIDRIDPVAALMNAFKRAMVDEVVVDINKSILSDDWSF